MLRNRIASYAVILFVFNSYVFSEQAMPEKKIYETKLSLFPQADSFVYCAVFNGEVAHGKIVKILKINVLMPKYIDNNQEWKTDISLFVDYVPENNKELSDFVLSLNKKKAIPLLPGQYTFEIRSDQWGTQLFVNGACRK